MSLIQITPTMLRTRATEIRQRKTEHDQAMTQLGNLVNSLNAEWKGVASDAFVQQFNAMRTRFTQFSQRLETMARQLDDTANRLEQADQQSRSQILSALQV